MQRAHKRIKEFFPVCRVYQAHIPTYPSGHWLFGFASKKYDPLTDIDERAWNIDEQAWNSLGLKTKYYNTDIHKGCFALPNYVKELLVSAGE
ncbi:MAG: spermidine synthase [Firmicutes bacterium]|nr:spermidine synthase [Bacillota bacterium]